MCRIIAGIILIVVCAAGTASEAHALTQGMSSKLKQMRDSAYAERMNNAQKFFQERQCLEAIREAQLALGHAKDDAEAAAARQILAACYEQTGQKEAQAAERKWLSQHS